MKKEKKEADNKTQRKAMVAFAKWVASAVMNKYPKHDDAKDVLRLTNDIIDVELYPSRSY